MSKSLMHSSISFDFDNLKILLLDASVDAPISYIASRYSS